MKFEKLENIAEVIAGQSPPSDTYNKTGEGLPFFQGKADFGDMYPTVRYWCTKPTKTALPNDILMSVRAPVGPVNLCDIESCIGRGLAAIRVSNEHYPKYIYYYLRDHERQIASLGVGSTFSSITKRQIKELKVPLPDSLDDEIIIATILSRAETLIKRRKESIALLHEFLRSTFFEMFGDPERNSKGFELTALEELCAAIVDCPHSTPIKSEKKTNYPCIRTSELTDGYISWNSMQYLDESEYIKRTQRLIPQVGDIVYGREGTFGEAVVLPSNYFFSLGQRTMLFRPDYNKTNSIFLWAMVRSEFVYRQAKKKNSGSTVGHVNVKDIKKFRVIHPPLYLQNQFAKIVNQIELIRHSYEQSLKELEDLYVSLSQEAFNGKLLLS